MPRRHPVFPGPSDPQDEADIRGMTRAGRSRSAQDRAQLQAGKMPPSLLLHEDERRAELLVDVVATVLILVYSLGGLAAYRHRRVSVGTYLYLIQLEGFVFQVSGLVAREPLPFG